MVLYYYKKEDLSDRGQIRTPIGRHSRKNYRYTRDQSNERYKQVLTMWNFPVFDMKGRDITVFDILLEFHSKLAYI